jgi:hypothetical protein
MFRIVTRSVIFSSRRNIKINNSCINLGARNFSKSIINLGARNFSKPIINLGARNFRKPVFKLRNNKISSTNDAKTRVTTNSIFLDGNKSLKTIYITLKNISISLLEVILLAWMIIGSTILLFYGWAYLNKYLC